jgi:hypothetical protein
MKNLCNSFFKIPNNLLEKLVLLLLAQHAIACHTITVIYYSFTSCSVVINLMFSTLKPLSIVSERIKKNKRWMRESYLFWIIWRELYEDYHYRAELSFELRIIKVFEITR